uniref:Uncharacterized protein n=1 Tax=Anguilla anguilla TaxID=7936 RepID=A0A0E9QEY7_ANGAN
MIITVIKRTLSTTISDSIY